MINIGILGCGNIARTRHIPEYAANPDCRITAYYNPSRGKAEALARQYGGKVYDSAEELLADPSIDAVSVCTANDAHAALSVAAMKAGKHVLCEKPIACTIEEAQEMLHISEETGRLLMASHNQRFLPAHREAKEYLDKGTIGKILSFRTTFGHGGPEMFMKVKDMNSWFFRKEKAAMGVMADLGVHKIDIIHYLTGERSMRVSAKLSTLDKCREDGSPISVDDNAVCLLEMESGAVGTVTASWTYYGQPDNSTVIYGSKGIMRLYDDPDHSLLIKLADGSLIAGRSGPMDFRAPSGVIDSWIESIKAGKVLESDGRSALDAMKTVFAAIKSSETGTSIEIH